MGRYVVATPATTHELVFEGDRVVKRFVSWDRGEHVREWRGLSLLARHAPGLAPEPIAARLDEQPPSIVMSRLPGEPLGDAPLTDVQVCALADALTRMFTSVPERELFEVEPMFDPERARATLLRMRKSVDMREGSHGADPSPTVRKAHETALAFTDSPWAERAAGVGPGASAAVFGQVDGNLANFLWDGEQVRVVDLEDSGRTDVAFELANLVEHISAVHGARLDAERLLAHFSLTPAQSARLRLCRQAFAVYWLLRLLPGGSSHRRNPPSTLEAQAAHLLALE